MKTKILGTIVMACLCIAVFIGGCKDDKTEIVGVCPVVVSTDPANEMTGVPLDKIINITFNEAMNPATITPASFSMQGELKSATESYGTLTYNGENFTMSFTPSVKLIANSTYTFTVSSSVKDLMGNALQVNYVSTFSTGTTLSPIMISTDPAKNATGVFLNKRIDATFNMAMDPLSFTSSTFIVKHDTTTIAGTVSGAGAMASFTPSVALAPNTMYTAIITTGVKNTLGTRLANDLTWSFTTGAVSAPRVSMTDPANLATNIALNKIISVTFSEPMDPAKITTSTFSVMQGSTSFSGTVNYSGTLATFTPFANLLSGNTYTVVVTTGAKNMAGISIANDYTWNFSTKAPLGPTVVNLKSVSGFGIIAGVGISNNAGFSEIHDMDVGISPGVRSSITGFPPAIMVNGVMYASDDIAPAGVAAMLTQAKQDLTDAYLFAEGAISPAPATVSGDQGGKTLAPGIYKSTSTLLIQSGNLTLDAQGDENAVWIFQIASAFTTVGGAGGNVILSGGAQAKNVFWQTGSSATIGDLTSFKGNILALTSITMNSGATVTGRMLVRNGSVVLTSSNTIYKP
jgi:hypothetical protein